MLAFLQTNTPIVIFNQIVVTLLTVCFLYQVVFFVIGALRARSRLLRPKNSIAMLFLSRRIMRRP